MSCIPGLEKTFYYLDDIHYSMLVQAASLLQALELSWVLLDRMEIPWNLGMLSREQLWGRSQFEVFITSGQFYIGKYPMRSPKGKSQTVLGKTGNVRLESPANALLKYRTRAGVTTHGACMDLRSGGRFFPFLLLSLLQWGAAYKLIYANIYVYI